MFSAGYEIGEITDGRFQEEAERLVAHPFTEAIEALETFPIPRSRRCPATRSAGASSWRSHVTCAWPRQGSSSACRLPSSGSSTRTPGLRRFIDAIGAPRTRELFLLGSYIDADDRAGVGPCQPRAPAARSMTLRSPWRASWPRNAPLSQVGNKRVIAALLRAPRRASRGCRSGVDRAAPRVVRLARPARGNGRLRREARPRWRGE